VNNNITYQHKLSQRALLLSYITVGYNIAEGLASILFGIPAGSIALIGFGLDSFIESLSGGIMIWRFRKQGKLEKEEEEQVEKKATRLVAYTFFILSLYILYESIKKLYLQEIPEASIPGIIIAVVSLIIMPVLFSMKYRIGKQLQSKSLIADSKETLACMFLSIALLTGLGLNYFLGLWQADPVVGLLIVLFLLREGYEILREEE
jgi:cation diffusion facilitator family transporter